jgi:hypothetical protein
MCPASTPEPDIRETPVMYQEPEVAVTLSRALFAQLKAEADRIGIPLAWLVASLVVDTMEPKTSALSGSLA